MLAAASERLALLPPPTAMPTSDEAVVIGLLEACAVAGVRRRALLVNLGSLPAGLMQPRHLKMIDAALDPLLGADRARLFRLQDHSIVVIWRGDALAALHRSILSLERLFADLPHGPALLSLLELPRDNERLAELVLAQLPEPPPPPEAAPKLPPAPLAALEAALRHTDPSSFSRRESVCSWSAEAGARLVWEGRSLSEAAVVRALAPGFGPQTDPWLRRRLTRSFDRRLLSLLCDPDELRRTGPFALRLNVASVLSPGFGRFDASLPPALRGEVVLDFSPVDIVANPVDFAFARDFMRAGGYLIAVRGLTPELLNVLPPEALGADFFQLRFAAGLRSVPAGLDPGRVVLSRVDGLAELEWGAQQGIGLFRGAALQPPPGAAPRVGLRRRLKG